jgi:uncharacterized membrane protein YfbV (UPF0208 family)
MDSISIIVIIIVLLACLVCYAFASQALEQKRQHRQRLLTALNIRANNLKYMLNSFPAGFLSKELSLLVQRSLIEVCEQMSRLEPGNPSHKQDLQAVTQQLNETRRQPAQKAQAVTLENPQQVANIKQSLEELYKVIHQQEQRKDISAAEASVYRTQIRQLVLGITVDSYLLQGHRARQQDKVRLAQHYYEVSLKLLQREDTTGAFEQKQARIKEWFKDVQAKAQHLGVAEVPVEDDDEQAQIDRAWERFSEAEEGWKKKNVYD